MKDWIKHLDDNEITRILGYKNLKREVPAWVDELIINRMKEKQRQETKKSPYAIRSLFAAAILILLVIPVFFIINNFQNNEQLILVRMSNDVTFQQNENIILLQPGDSPDKNSSIITGVDSDCILHYSDKITITIHEKAEVKISENNKKRITFHLAVGEITIKEEKVKGLRIGVKTPVASIYAIGTYYSVTHNVKKEETKIKTYDGTLHIETIPAGEKIILQQGREVIIKKDELPGIHEILLSDKDYEVKWTVRPLYSNPKIREPITGFAVFDNKIIASTNYSIVCMTHGELLWERFPERRLFNAKPVVYNQTVYIPTPDSIVSFDLQTGIPKPEIRVKEGLKPGHTITTY
ncbi:MAG: FecR domain-containing protein, partial [Spirochaetales bacterium]|nr:FecR domain-containing protein [Spirochaetales bacterium]